VKLLQNRSPEVSHLLCFRILLEKILKIVLEKISGRSNVFIISKRQSSLSSTFYDGKQTLQAEEIPILFALIDLTG